MMYRCCIFDLDGTLLNTIGSLVYAINGMLKHFGYPAIGEAQVKQFVGDGYEKLVERSLRFSGDEALVHYEEALKVYMEIFQANALYEVKPYDGIMELLEYLKAQGIRLTVLSNKPNAQTIENIETIFGKGYFDFVAGERPEIPRKPDPAGVIQILEMFGESTGHCLYFGDTSTDMETGLGAGVTTVGVTWGFRGREELESFNPNYVIDSPREVLEKIFIEMV